MRDRHVLPSINSDLVGAPEGAASGTVTTGAVAIAIGSTAPGATATTMENTAVHKTLMKKFKIREYMLGEYDIHSGDMHARIIALSKFIGDVKELVVGKKTQGTGESTLWDIFHCGNAEKLASTSPPDAVNTHQSVTTYLCEWIPDAVYSSVMGEYPEGRKASHNTQGKICSPMTREDLKKVYKSLKLGENKPLLSLEGLEKVGNDLTSDMWRRSHIAGRDGVSCSNNLRRYAVLVTLFSGIASGLCVPGLVIASNAKDNTYNNDGIKILYSVPAAMALPFLCVLAAYSNILIRTRLEEHRTTAAQEERLRLSLGAKAGHEEITLSSVAPTQPAVALGDVAIQILPVETGRDGGSAVATETPAGLPLGAGVGTLARTGGGAATITPEPGEGSSATTGGAGAPAAPYQAPEAAVITLAGVEAIRRGSWSGAITTPPASVSARRASF